MSCIIEWSGKNIHWRFQGTVDSTQLIEAFAALYGDERFDDTRGQIRNYSELTGGEVSLIDVQKIAAFDRAAAKSNPNMKVALVTSGKESHTAMAALYDAELYGTSWKVNIFDRIEDAMDWVS